MPSLKQATKAIKAGDKATAGQILRNIIGAEPENEMAWLWMTRAVGTKGDQRKCLNKVLEINPDSEPAKKALEILDEREKKKLTAEFEGMEVAIAEPQANGGVLLNREVARFTAKGWQVISQTETSVQLRKPKQWSVVLLVLGVITLVFFGFGLLLLVLAVVDYALKKERVIFFTAANIRAGDVPSPTTPLNPALIIIVILLLVLFFACMGISLQG